VKESNWIHSKIEINKLINDTLNAILFIKEFVLLSTVLIEATVLDPEAETSLPFINNKGKQPNKGIINNNFNIV
jgi:hypothetical protein